MSPADLSVGETVRVVLDPVAKSFGEAIGVIEYIDEQRVRVRFDGDDEFTYWFRPNQLAPAHRVGTAKEG